MRTLGLYFQASVEHGENLNKNFFLNNLSYKCLLSIGLGLYKNASFDTAITITRNQLLIDYFIEIISADCFIL